MAVSSTNRDQEHLNRAIELGTSMFYSYYVLAWVEMSLGDYEKARKACEL